MEYEWNALDGVLHTMQSLQYSEVFYLLLLHKLILEQMTKESNTL